MSGSRRRRRWAACGVDRGSILIVVYVAFGQGVRDGVWHQVDAAQLVTLLAVCVVLLGLVLSGTWLLGRGAGQLPGTTR